MKKAKVQYHENYYGQEGYAVEIFSDDDWGLDSFFPCVRREEADEDEGKNFVHFSLINKIAQLNRLGYQIEIR